GWSSLIAVLRRRSSREAINAVIISLVAIAIVVFLNLIAVEHDWKKDLTKSKLHTLSEQSETVVKNIKSPVVIKAFVEPMKMPEYERVFEKYTYHNKLL